METGKVGDWKNGKRMQMYESVLTCPVLSDSLFVTLTFSKVITWKNIKSYQNIRRFQRRSCDKVSFIRTFNFR